MYIIVLVMAVNGRTVNKDGEREEREERALVVRDVSVAHSLRRRTSWMPITTP